MVLGKQGLVEKDTTESGKVISRKQDNKPPYW